MINKIINYFLIIIKAKYTFSKPTHTKILIYDTVSSSIIKLLFPKKKKQNFDSRHESINIYVLFFTVKKTGYRRLIYNYKTNYIKLINPKLIITAKDTDLFFYQLKTDFPKIKFISIQEGRRDNEFFERCKEYYNENNLRLKIDFFFVLSHSEINRFKQYIDSKFIVLGSVKNNYFYRVKNKKNKNKKVLFISKRIFFFLRNSEIKVFNNVYRFCTINNYKLTLCTRSNISEEKFFREKLKEGNWQFLPYSVKNSYNAINNYDLIIFTNSTLGFEALAKKKKVVCFPPSKNDFPISGFPKKYSSEGFFWSTKNNYLNMKKVINRVENYSNDTWKSKAHHFIKDIMYYNPKNTFFFKIYNRLQQKIYD
jgi:surface carbohydrate biosynthesis protein